ncbi:MAG: M13 family metallopeptidase [Hyphomonadaceae bacterium]
MKRHILLASALLFAGCSPAAPTYEAGIDAAGMDTAVKPGDDFFAYGNGTWDKATEIPADRSTWGGNAILAERVDKDVAALIAGAGEGTPKPGSEAAMIADFYKAYMDEAGIEAKGAEPLKAELANIDTIKDLTSLSSYFGSTLRAECDVMNATQLTTDSLFCLWVAADFDKPDTYAPFLMQGGLSLPDRDYYLADTPRMADVRTAFKAHIEKVLTLAGVADAKAKAQRIFDLEAKIAGAHVSVDDTSDPAKGNNHWTRAELDAKAPGMDWAAFLDTAKLAGQQGFVIWQPAAFTGESALVKATPVATWKEYLAFHYIDRNSSQLSKAFVDERFDFYGKTLSGTPQLQERWKRGVAATNAALGEAVGHLYVDKYFPPASKAAVQEMVANITASFEKRIDALDWMDPATKKEAKAKLAVLKVGIGYPDKWRSYEGLDVATDDAFGNVQNAAQSDSDQKIARLGMAVDRGEWVMNPQLVNAVNLPILNALNFPAAELQPPHFDPKAPAAVNYAAVGAIIGHEISHSFDNNGALFDSTGRMRNWWTAEDFAHFTASGEALAKQYDAYKPFPDLNLNGKLTLSENIADVAGLAAAYDAYRTSEGGKEGPTVGGFTGDQQFFISFAQTWRYKAREAAMRRQVLTNGHAPAPYRALTVRNLDAWYTAFGVKEGDKLYLPPAERVKVW